MGKRSRSARAVRKIRVFEHLGQFWKELVAERSELIFALGTLLHQFVAVANEASELFGGFCWGKRSAYQLQLIGHLRPEFQLTVEGISQAQGIPLIRFEHAFGSFLHMDDVDREI